MLNRFTIQQRFGVLLIFWFVCFVVCGAIMNYTMDEVKVNGPIYKRIVQGQDLIADILPPPAYIIESYLTVLQMQTTPDSEKQDEYLRRLKKLVREYYASYNHWREVEFDSKLQDAFLVQSHSLVHLFYDTVYTQYVPALHAHDYAAAARALDKIHQTYELQRAAIEQVVVLAKASNRAYEDVANDKMHQMLVALVAVYVLIFVVFALILSMVGRSIANPILKALKIAKQVASGEWNQNINVSDKDETGQLLNAIKDIVRNTRTELVQAEKMAALGSLVAGVSHELNTPVGNGLMAISTLTREVHEFRLKSETTMKRSVLEDFLQTVEAAADISTRNLERAAMLVSSFKQVAVDRTSSQRRTFYLHDVLQETQLILKPMLKRGNCQLILKAPTSINMDSFPGPLGQVISNMIENAIKHAYTETGGDITVETQELTSQYSAVITISDHGKGIPPELHNRIYEPFFTTKLGQGGSGLGLHISHNIVYNMLGGSIKVISTVGKGTSFVVTIPLVAPREVQVA